MTPSDALSHSVTACLDVPAAVAFGFLRDPAAVGGWALGSMDTRPFGDEGIHTGRSLFDGGATFFRIDADPARLVVDYLIGEPDDLSARISVRVVPADAVGLAPTQCYVTLTTWRVASMSDARWHALRATHEVEILLIKARCEATRGGE